MPTTKPRITITLTEEQHVLLHTLAGYQGESMSAIVVDLIQTAVPVMERIAIVMKAASTAPQEMLDGMKQSMERAEAQLISQMQGHIDQLDAMTKNTAGAAVGMARPAARATPALPRRTSAARPPTSNRGVRITTDYPRSPMKPSVSEKKGREVKK
jgi:uncharacterized protein (DUF1778 family)